MNSSVRSGAVVWTGDNPFIYLKTDPEGEWASLSLFFRITASQHGVGHAMLVIERPLDPEPGATRRLMTDNEELADRLLEDFVARFALFRPFDGWEAVERITAASFQSEPGDSVWTERARSSDGAQEVEMVWTGLQPPFAVDLPPDQSSTGAHEMMSVFRTATEATVTVDGRRLPGATVERDFLTGRCQSAALALSETWIEQ